MDPENRPFVLVYQEAYDDSKVARQRELFFNQERVVVGWMIHSTDK
jgi:hypothetical protein